MKKLSVNGQKWLKAFHVLFVATWAGSALSLVAGIILLASADAEVVVGASVALDFIDDYVIVPAGVGTVITALLYSNFTKWGWFKHRWMAVKWGILLIGLIGGGVFLGPWWNTLPILTKEYGADVFSNPEFIQNRQNLMVYGTLQTATVILAIFLAVRKPWKKKKS